MLNKFIIQIITSAVALLVSALKFIPKITQAEFDSAIDLATTQLQNAKATFDQVSAETTEQVIANMVVDGLNVTQAALDATGDTKYDSWLQEGIAFIGTFAANGGHPVAAAIKTFFTNLFTKKKPATS